MSKSHRLTILGLSVALATFVVLTIKDSVIANRHQTPVQPPIEVISTDHTKCFDEALSGSANKTILFARIVDCQRIIQELTDQAHDEFDMD